MARDEARVSISKVFIEMLISVDSPSDSWHVIAAELAFMTGVWTFDTVLTFDDVSHLILLFRLREKVGNSLEPSPVMRADFFGECRLISPAVADSARNESAV